MTLRDSWGVEAAGRQPYLAAAEALIAESGCTILTWRTRNTGAAYTDDPEWGISVPHPRGPVSFGTFAHEVGHHMLRHVGSRKPRWLEEIEAWEWALAQFDRFELPGKERSIIDALKAIGHTAERVLRRRVTDETRQRLERRLTEFSQNAGRNGQDTVRSGVGT